MQLFSCFQLFFCYMSENHSHDLDLTPLLGCVWGLGGWFFDYRIGSHGMNITMKLTIIMFPKVPQSSLGILRVPQLPPPLGHPRLKNPIIFGRISLVHNFSIHIERRQIQVFQVCIQLGWVGIDRSKHPEKPPIAPFQGVNLLLGSGRVPFLP